MTITDLITTVVVLLGVLVMAATAVTLWFVEAADPRPAADVVDLGARRAAGPRAARSVA